MGGRSSRRKGADFERTMVHRFREVFGDEDVRRGLQSRGEEVSDVDVPCFWIECKRMKQTNPRAALRQDIEDSGGKGFWPIAVCKDDGQPAFVSMTLDDFLELVTEWWTVKSA